MNNKKKMNALQIRNIFDRHQSLCNCDEVYGVLCGMLAVDISIEFRHWIQEAQKIGANESCFEGDFENSAWNTFFEDIAAGFNRGDLSFKPLLNADISGDYSVRMQALIDWCNGFMYGIAIVDPRFMDYLSEANRKFIADISEIASATCVDSDAGDQEENEIAYQRVVEYLGIGVMLMCDEIASKKRSIH